MNNNGSSSILSVAGPYLILGGLGFAAYFIIKGELTGAVKAVGESLGLADSDDLKKLSDKELSLLKPNESELNYNKQLYVAMSAQLLQAMEGIGTDEESVLNVLTKIKNKSDWQYLQKVFGSPSGVGLREWLRSEFSYSVGVSLAWYGPKIEISNDKKKILAIMDKYDATYYKVVASNTFKGRTIVTLLARNPDPKKKELLPALNIPTGKDVGVLLRKVIIPTGNTSTMYYLIQRGSKENNDRKYFYVLASQAKLVKV